ncbi:glycosyltransferase [Vibrio cyclitrophicus]
MKIAIALCVYRGDRLDYLLACVESLLSQGNNDYNIRIYVHIDGKINENIRDYLYSGVCYKIIESNDNVGLAKGLNKIIDVLEDEKYVLRMDADDIALPSRVRDQIEYMEKNPNIEFSGASIKEFIGETENVYIQRNYPSTNEGIIKKIKMSSPFAHVTVCFKRDLLRKFKYPTNYPLNEDIAFWYKLLSSGVCSGNLCKVTDSRENDRCLSSENVYKSSIRI